MRPINKLCSEPHFTALVVWPLLILLSYSTSTFSVPANASPTRSLTTFRNNSNSNSKNNSNKSTTSTASIWTTIHIPSLPKRLGPQASRFPRAVLSSVCSSRSSGSIHHSGSPCATITTPITQSRTHAAKLRSLFSRPFFRNGARSDPHLPTAASAPLTSSTGARDRHVFSQ